MFKKFLQEIIDAKSPNELWHIFNRADGIDASYQQEKITWKEHQMLYNLINKLETIAPDSTSF